MTVDTNNPIRLFIAGDSTANNSTDGEHGWGEFIDQVLDPSRVVVRNHAIGARSTRTFRREGRWQQLLDDARPGDLVLIQFGHNDLQPIDDDRERGTLEGIGEQSQDVTLQNGTPETVYTYGRYLRQFIREAKENRLIPIVLSWVPMCPAADATRIGPDPAVSTRYALWARQVAEQEGTTFLDIHRAVLEQYRSLSASEIKRRYFTPSDDVHTNEDGARQNAFTIAHCLAELDGIDIGSPREVSPQAD